MRNHFSTKYACHLLEKGVDTISRTCFLVAKINPAILIMIMIHLYNFRFQQSITPTILTHNYVSELLIGDRITTEYRLFRVQCKRPIVQVIDLYPYQKQTF